MAFVKYLNFKLVMLKSKVDSNNSPRNYIVHEEFKSN